MLSSNALCRRTGLQTRQDHYHTTGDRQDSPIFQTAPEQFVRRAQEIAQCVSLVWYAADLS